MVNVIKTLELEFTPDGGGSAISVECQLSNAVLHGEGSEESVTTFCGTETFPGTVTRTLDIGGFQDWGQADAVCDLLHAAWKNGQDSSDTTSDLIDFTLTVGGKTRAGQCRSISDVDFGGEAGAPLEFESTLSVVGAVTDGTAP